MFRISGGARDGRGSARHTSVAGSATKLGLVVATIMGAQGLGCGPEESTFDDESLSAVEVREEPLYVASTKVWQNRAIPVCWETAGNDLEKYWVRQSVEESWQRYTGVSFTGWGTCNAATNSGIRITTVDQWPLTTALGSDMNNRVGGMVLNFWFNFSQTVDGVTSQPFAGCMGAARENCIRHIGVHEFGHALGLAHEQNRSDTPSTCTQKPQGENGDRILGAWDIMSVMNYCNPVTNNDARLSKTDISQMIKVYGLPATPTLCKYTEDYTKVAHTCGDPSAQARCNFGDAELTFTTEEEGLVCGPPRDRWERTRVTRNCRADVYVACDRTRVTSVARTTNNLDLFIVGGDGRVYTSWQVAGGAFSGAGDAWRAIGGFFPPGSPIAAVARNATTLDLFVTGYDGRIYTSSWIEGREWSGINNTWRAIGGFFPVGAPVTAVARTANNLDLFVTGYDGRVYTSWWFAGGDWSGINDNWRAIGGFFPQGTQVSAVARTANNLDLFVTGHDGRVYTSWWSAGNEWSGINNTWMSLDGSFPASATVTTIARTPNNLDLFVTGKDGRVYTRWWGASFGWHNTWMSLGGFFPEGAVASVASLGAENLNLFITGHDGRVYTSWWAAGFPWSGVADNWAPLAGVFPVGTPMSAVARDANNLDVFGMARDRRVYVNRWTRAAGWQGVSSVGGFF